MLRFIRRQTRTLFARVRPQRCLVIFRTVFMFSFCCWCCFRFFSSVCFEQTSKTKRDPHTHTRYFVSRFRFLHASAQRFVLFYRLCFVLFSPITASCSRSMWGCLPQPTRCFDYPFVLRASGTHRFVGRWCFIQHVLNVCSERNVSFSFSTLSRNKTKTTLRSDPAFSQPILSTDLRQGHVGSQLRSLCVLRPCRLAHRP